MRTTALATLAAILLASTSGMAFADTIDTGVGKDAARDSAAPLGFVLKATLSKGGKEIDHHYFGRGDETTVFATKDACDQFQTLPFFPAIRAQLDAGIAHMYPGGDVTAVLTCEPADSE